MRINWNEPRFGEEELKEITEVLNTAYVNEGPKTKELEDLIKKYLGSKYVVLTTSATAALFLAIKAEAKLRGIEDFEVIIPDMTMIATATSVGWAGGRVVLVDIEKGRLTMDPKKIEEKINSKTIAIIPVHTIGRACNMKKIREIADKYNLVVIEDAAGALGSKYDGKFLGTLGKIGCFSLQSNKIVTSGQGGILVTDDKKSYEMVRRLRDFGRLSNKEFLHDEEGYNLKFNDLSAALGLAQFRKIEKRKEILLRQREDYEMWLNVVEEIKFPVFRDGEIPLWIEVFVKERDKLTNFLKSFEIYTRPCWPSIHKNKPYVNRGSNIDFPNSTYASENVIWLPNGPGISKENIQYICKKIREFYKR